ncbi:uncharacterized protein BKA78DRAFT_300835 [Phyllosticta capitalensis]|uniref:uncharacterized protein n=1 Tax=Phyllosticta capitalensis TaxID=121624 RepID=UPI0031311162
MSFAHSFDSLVDLECLPVGTTGFAIHPAPRRIWDRLIWVICTIKGYSYRVINEFFVIADSPLPIQERDSGFLFFRTKETRSFESRRKEIVARGGIWYIERDGKAEEPIDPEDVPANMWPVSVELDEQANMDQRSCLIRVNGKLHETGFGEVRCDWQSALHVAYEILHNVSTVAESQNQAAVHGGVFPDDWRCSERDHLPQELLRPSMPVGWRRHPDERKSPWPVVEEFLDHVNSPFDSKRRCRVRVVDIDLMNANRYDFVDESPVPRLSGCFRGLSYQAICDFLQRKRIGEISCTNFVILDKHTSRPHVKEPKFIKEPAYIRDRDCSNFRGREWHCILGDTSDRQWKRLMMARCAFDSCAEVIDNVNRRRGCLGEYANHAAVEGSGFFRFPTDRAGVDGRARKEQLDRDLESLLAKNKGIIPAENRDPVAVTQTVAVEANQGKKRDASPAPPDSQQQEQPPRKKRKRRRKKKDHGEEAAVELGQIDDEPPLPRATPPTPPPERRHKISDLKPGGDYHYTSSPEHNYDLLFSQSFALSYTDADADARGVDHRGRPEASLPSFNLLDSCTPADSHSMTQRDWGVWENHDDDDHADADRAMRTSQVTEADDDADDDDFIRLPEATGSTQML